MENHITACHSKNKRNGDIIGDNDKSIDETSDPSLWKSGQKCPFGCPGRWNIPERLETHKKEASHQHLEYLNKRVVNLESTLNKENDMNTPMIGSQQQPSSPPLENEMEEMDETEPGMSQQSSQRVDF